VRPGVRIGTPGFRTRQITLVTTLLEAAVYQGDDLAELYRQRWQIETSGNFRLRYAWKKISVFLHGVNR
jgi:IS4 transposase